MRHEDTTTVMPAQAGIQANVKRRRKSWIPAFAGMTLMLLFAASAHAEDSQRPKFSLALSEDDSVWVGFGGQVRVRGEVWNNFGFSNAGDRDDEFLLTRVLLHADLHVGENLRFYIEGKSAMSTDDDAPVGNRTLEVDEADLQNAYAELTVPLGDDVSVMLRGGRQELLYGKQRLVSPLDWANVRRTFEGGRADVRWRDWTISTFWTKPVIVDKYDFNEPDGDADFFGLYATGPLPAPGSENIYTLDLYYLGLDRDATSIPGGGFNGTAGDEERHTVGGRLAGKIMDTAFDFDIEGAYQFGEVGSGDISAFMFASEMGYTFADCPATPRVHLGFDYASGDDSPGGDVETFNQLFPLGHAYLGWIDVVGRQNIIDVTPGVTVKPLDKLTVKLNGHFYWRAEQSDALYNAGGGVVRAGGPGTSKQVGSEIDLLVSYKFDDHLTATAGYSHFFAGDFIEDTGSAEDIDFTYLIVQYTF